MAEESVVRTRGLLMQRLELAHRWYERMISPSTGMLEYLYVPGVTARAHEGSPIRDIASIWDAAVLADFLNREELRALIERSLRHYEAYLASRDDHLILDERRLGEPSSIAHSAFMILALLRGPPPPRAHQITALAAGILAQQRLDGSYKVFFEDLPDCGEELYGGEAMLALMETYRQFQDEQYLHSVERGCSFYDAQYFDRGRVAEDTLVFFANWQSQACRLLFEWGAQPAVRQQIQGYLCRMHDKIIGEGFYDSVRMCPAQHTSVEVACALEGLNDAYALVPSTHAGRRAERYRACICAGLAYLLKLQCTQNGTRKERGGFAMTLGQRAQRIDVTGHAVSAFIKSVDNDLDCDLQPE